MSSNKTKNPWFEAKRLIIADYNNGKILDNMDAKDVFKMHGVYETVRYDRFEANFKRLKKSGFKDNARKATTKETIPSQQKETSPALKEVLPSKPWPIAKQFIYDDYVAGKITDDTDLDHLHTTKDVYEAVRIDRFKDNTTRLIKRIKKDQGRAQRDLEGYQRDTTIQKLAKKIMGEWNGSEAEILLKEAIQKGLHNKYTLKELYGKKEAYQKFDYDIFVGHVYQEKRHLVESGYWLVKKKKIEKKKEAKRLGEKYKEEDNDFYDPVLNFETLRTWTYEK